MEGVHNLLERNDHRAIRVWYYQPNQLMSRGTPHHEFVTNDKGCQFVSDKMVMLDSWYKCNSKWTYDEEAAIDWTNEEMDLHGA